MDDNTKVLNMFLRAVDEEKLKSFDTIHNYILDDDTDKSAAELKQMLLSVFSKYTVNVSLLSELYLGDDFSFSEYMDKLTSL